MLAILASAAALLPLLAGAIPLVAKDGVSQYIWAGTNGLCLTVSGTPGDGSAVTSGPCNIASLWDIYDGNGMVVLHGTSFCLDAGTNPHNNVLAKVWTCYPGLTQQQWYYTDDDRIAITGGDQCLDEGPIGPQTYQCTTGNTNQVWYTYGGSGPTTTTSTSVSTSATTATSTTSSAASSPTVPVTQGVVLHPNGDSSKCLTVAYGNPSDGQAVQISSCFQPGDSFAGLQKWIIYPGSGSVQLAGTNFCLDAGVNPSNGVGAKIWTCYPGLTQQTWYYTDDNRIAITGGDQCLDVTAGSQPVPAIPYGSLESVQTWQCTTGDTQQIWTV